ncbi:hypothetical protein ASPBRDRAFT_191292 [Aspergillus brasiliensis CBS 101740]|uniref:Rhodopsin domain-containing protein n=1 Tax=Aspergillus brasiliensis (strain CBS 101740 / IMI 381727 / IBT 21946) TaxID=767769 RepID=A0A1L9V296_ASPBC|nr:hypothetical protein ASPBRDRAFT_191292 [Aspergillus brasiliensis CBS 101740]
MPSDENEGITSTAKAIITVTTILEIVAILAVSLRIYTRINYKLYLGVDDWTIIAALLLSCGTSIIADYGIVVTGIGDPNYQSTRDSTVLALKIKLAFENAQVATMGVIKISVLFFYRRIFGISRRFVTASNVLIALITSFTLATILAIIFSKGPVYRQWDLTASYNTNPSAIIICYIAGNSFFDLLTLALPIAAIQRLHVDQSKKLFVSVIFVLGNTCIAASFVRLYYAVQWTRDTTTFSSMSDAVLSSMSPDSPFVYNILWAIIEPPIFIAVGSMLTLGPLIRDRRGPRQWIRILRGKKESAISYGARNCLHTHTPSGNSYQRVAEMRTNSTSSSEVELLSVERPTGFGDSRCRP